MYFPTGERSGLLEERQMLALMEVDMPGDHQNL